MHPESARVNKKMKHHFVTCGNLFVVVNKASIGSDQCLPSSVQPLLTDITTPNFLWLKCSSNKTIRSWPVIYQMTREAASLLHVYSFWHMHAETGPEQDTGQSVGTLASVLFWLESYQRVWLVVIRRYNTSGSWLVGEMGEYHWY